MNNWVRVKSHYQFQNAKKTVFSLKELGVRLYNFFQKNLYIIFLVSVSLLVCPEDYSRTEQDRTKRTTDLKSAWSG